MSDEALLTALDDLDQVDPDLARFLSELDFDLGLAGFDDWCDTQEFNLDEEGFDGEHQEDLQHGGKVTIAQRMRKAGFKTVDLLREDDLARAQSLYDRVTSDHIYKERKRPRLKDGIPRIMRNDIRWSYAQMFMNTVNSADFSKMQGFFHTFMTKPCKFIVDHEINPEFGIPHRLLVNGPKLMAHYLLGVFVIFPDMVLKMTDNKIISSRGWTGSKIVIEIELCSTKLYDISLEAWVPQVKYLAKFKEKQDSEVAIKSENVTELNSSGVSSSNSAPTHDDATAMGIDAAEGGEPKIDKIIDISESTDYLEAANTEIARKGYRYMNSIKKANEEHLQKKRKLDSLLESAAGAGAGTGEAVAGDSSGANKKPVCGINFVPNHTFGSSAGLDGLGRLGMGGLGGLGGLAGAWSGASAASMAMMAQNFTPGKMMEALFATAKLQDKPKILKAKGVITMFLDANNNMQHLNLVLAQNTDVVP